MSDSKPEAEAQTPANLPQPRDLGAPHRVLTKGVEPSPPPPGPDR
jgi:hypothetical protein